MARGADGLGEGSTRVGWKGCLQEAAASANGEDIRAHEGRGAPGSEAGGLRRCRCGRRTEAHNRWVAKNGDRKKERDNIRHAEYDSKRDWVDDTAT